MPHVERRYGHHFKPLGLDIAGDVVEKLRRVAPGARIGGEKAEVGIDARRHRVIIAGAEVAIGAIPLPFAPHDHRQLGVRSEEHTSELQSLMRISYAVFCLKKKNKTQATN